MRKDKVRSEEELQDIGRENKYILAQLVGTHKDDIHKERL